MTRYVLGLDSETELTRPGVAAPRLVVVSASLDSRTAALFHRTEARAFLRRVLLEAARGRLRIAGHNITGYDLKIFAAYAPGLIPLIFAALDADGIVDTQINEQLLDLAQGRLRGPVVVANDDDEADDDDAANEDAEPEAVPDGVTVAKRGYALDEIHQRRGGRALDKGPDSWRLRYGELIDTPLEAWPEAAIEYPKEDAIAPRQVYASQLEDAKALAAMGLPNVLGPAAGECRAAFALSLMCAWGLHTDRDRVDALERRNQVRQDKARELMIEAGLIRDDNINPRTGQRRRFKATGEDKPPHWVRNTKVIKAELERAYRAQGIAVPVTEKGNTSTAAQHLMRSKVAGLQAGVEYARAQKMLTTYVPLLRRGEEHPIQASFDSIKETGRVSTWNPNLANLPRVGGARECFVPRPGYVFCSVDYSSAELRAWAQVCLLTVGRSRMAEVFQADPNADPHTTFAAMMLGIDEAEAKAKKKSDPVVKAARQRAKAANFGFPGGMGVAKFVATERKKYWDSFDPETGKASDGIDLTEDEGRELRDAWGRMWPESAPYFKWVQRQIDRTDNGEGLGVFRCFASGRWRGGCGFTQGANNGFQALIAWCTKQAQYEVTRRCYVRTPGSALFGSRVVNMAHDELIAELPEDVAHDAAHEMTRVMVEVAQRFLPDVPMTAEPALMRAWYKDAEAVYTPDGKLIPWEPKPKAAPPPTPDGAFWTPAVAVPLPGVHPACVLCGKADDRVGSGHVPGVVSLDKPHHLACALDAYAKRSA